MRRFQDSRRERRTAKILVVLGVAMALPGFVGVVAAFTFAPGQIVGIGFGIFSVAVGSGLAALGRTQAREADAVEREQRLSEGGRGRVASSPERLLEEVEGRRRAERRRLRFLLAGVGIGAVVLASALAVFVPRPPRQELFAVETFRRLYEEAIVLAEKEYGHALRRKPELRVASRADATDLLASAWRAEWGRQNPGRRPPPEVGAGLAYAAWARPALYVPFDHLIVAIPMNVVDGAERAGTERVYVGEDYLRCLLVHELVHALDEENRRLFARSVALGDSAEGLVWRALTEGHAEHLAQRAMAGLGRLEWLREYRRLQDGPNEVNERFKYVYGRQFFERAEAAGLGGWTAGLFRHPPPDPEALLEPDDYFDGLRPSAPGGAAATAEAAFRIPARPLPEGNEAEHAVPELLQLVQRGDRLFAEGLEALRGADRAEDPRGWRTLNDRALEAFLAALREGYGPADERFGEGREPPFLLERLRAAKANASNCRARRHAP